MFCHTCFHNCTIITNTLKIPERPCPRQVYAKQKEVQVHVQYIMEQSTMI